MEVVSVFLVLIPGLNNEVFFKFCHLYRSPVNQEGIVQNMEFIVQGTQLVALNICDVIEIVSSSNYTWTILSDLPSHDRRSS